MFQPEVKNGPHTKVLPNSIAETSLLGSGLKGVGDRSWRAALEKKGELAFDTEIEGTNPPRKTFTFPKGGTIALTQADGRFTLTWEGEMEGKKTKITLEFSKGKAAKLDPPEPEVVLPKK